ncbi:hypothetical protein KAW64_09575, partial [bacterium]|nr:hypothetical protein [bacterium]
MNTVKRAGLFSIVIAVVLAAGGAAMAATFVISPDGLGDYPTIQAAVNAATDGDIIELTDGTFTGDGNRDIAVPSRPITIRSQSGNCMDCVIDCEGSARAEHRGFRFETAVGTGDVTLEDIGIINGYVSDGGGGIWIIGASPRIDGCAISMCTVAGNYNKGGGIYVSDGGDPEVFFCLISQNTADYGGGVAVFVAAGMFHSCDITDNEATNTAGGVYITANGDVAFWYCDIVSNTAVRAGGVRMSGGTVYLQSCNVSRNEATASHSGGIWLQGGFVNGCTIVENSAAQHGGGVYCKDGTGGLNQCIIAFTEAGYGVGASEGNAPSLDCCDVYENAGGNYDAEVGDQTGFDDNFSLDP